jgi:hypothetical protein
MYIIQFSCISLHFSFAFNNFESLPQNFGLTQTNSKFGNFGLGDGKKLKKSISQLSSNYYNSVFGVWLLKELNF